MKNSLEKISIVIPVYSSQSILDELVSRLVTVLSGTGWDYEIILVDDCSPDASWAALTELKSKHSKELKIARLLKNRGQHNAILCGFSLATGQVVITMDDDLQNPPEEIPLLVEPIIKGYDLVIGAYDSKKHSRLKNACGQLIDSLLRLIFRLPGDFQLTNFRAIRKVVIDNVCKMDGAYPYITAMLLSQTSNYKNVSVRHDERLVGKSTYTIWRSIRLAANLILGYSTLPIWLALGLCCFTFLLSLMPLLSLALQGRLFASTMSGWLFPVSILLFSNALMLLCLCIFGCYLMRIYQQVTKIRVNFTLQEWHD
jgi:polyisoprenyl-phosphate glycosyltransferase